MIVDDTGELLKSTTPILPAGWTVEAYDAPLKALTRVNQPALIAVIVNLRSTSFDALNLLQEVASVSPHIRRILSADAAAAGEILRAVNEVGVHRVIGTPLTQDRLHEALEGAYAQRRRELAVEYLLEDLRAKNRQLQSAQAALHERESHLLHSERLAVLGRLTDGLASGIQPLLNELREVVSSLTTAQALGEEAPLDEAMMEDDLLGIGHDAVEAVWDIIQDIGRFTRDDQVQLRRESVELGELIERTVRFASFDQRLKLRRLVITSESSVQIKVDARRIRQVLLNLLRNAADATDEGAKISVSLKREEEWAELKVTDEGTGMPPQVADLVFEEFFSTKGDGGLGLGLSLCRSTIMQHGGAISCDTTMGEGTTFSVRLPLLEQEGT